MTFPRKTFFAMTTKRRKSQDVDSGLGRRKFLKHHRSSRKGATINIRKNQDLDNGLMNGAMSSVTDHCSSYGKAMTTRGKYQDLENGLMGPKFAPTDLHTPAVFRWELFTVCSSEPSFLETLDVSILWKKDDLIERFRDALTSAEASSELYCTRPIQALRPKIKALRPTLDDFSDIHVVIFVDTENRDNGLHSYHRYKVNLVSFYGTFYGREIWNLELEGDLGDMLEPDIVAGDKLILIRARFDDRTRSIRVRFADLEFGKVPVQLFRFVVSNNRESSQRNISTTSTQSGTSFRTAKASQEWMETDDPMDDIMGQMSSQPLDLDSDPVTDNHDHKTRLPPTTGRGWSELSNNSQDYPLIGIHSDSE